MNAHLSFSTQLSQTIDIKITGSKSESNRLLILQAIFDTLSIRNLSNSDDTQVLRKALKSKDKTIDVHHAGTAMRFLTAFFACQEGNEVVLTGSKRMQERPVRILVDALRDLGAHITYLKEEGFPPLQIIGRALSKSTVVMKANVSSQYISALMLIAPSLPKGLKIILEGELTSVPYITMTCQLLNDVGVPCRLRGFEQPNIPTEILIENVSQLAEKTIAVESDWSSASYFFSLVALSNDLQITLTNYKEKSLQGDRALVEIYAKLGVSAVFNSSEESITLSKIPAEVSSAITLNLIDTPDIAQTIAVTCFGLGLGCNLTGLHTLKIKETDRLEALKNELVKLGADVEVSNDSLQMNPCSDPEAGVTITTYQDHRMAMAFAPLSMRFPIVIEDAMVVTKSFPQFYEELEKLGIAIDLK